MAYCYFVISPDIGDRGLDAIFQASERTQSVFCKFGITSNADLEKTRAGYAIHNPSFRFIKSIYKNT